MDDWEALVECFEVPKEPNAFLKILETAEAVLDKDLAPFEIDWILTTLLRKPVGLIDIVKAHRCHEIWSKVISDSLKLLGKIVTTYQYTSLYYEDIVKICLLPYDPQTKQQALNCLTNIARRSEEGASDVGRHIAMLDEGTTCKAPLAVLIGTICEHHPTVVSEDIVLIWRLFLNMLESNKFTVTVIKAVFQGIYGLFKHFGRELPTKELDEFYDKLVDNMEHQRCEDVCLLILQEHMDLFRERVASDVRLRRELWSRASTSANARGALLHAYRVMAGQSNIQNIIATEIEPHTQSSRALEKFTALRVLTNIQTQVSVGDMSDRVDIHALEFDLRNGNVNYNVAEAILWCIEANIPHSDKLLQAALLFYEAFPTTKRRAVIHGLLKSPEDRRSVAITFLISETCQTQSDTCLKIWREIFDTKLGADEVVVEGSARVLDDFVGYALFVLEGLEERGEEETLPEPISSLLSLTYEILSLQEANDSLNDSCAPLVPVLLEYASRHASAVPAAILACTLSGSKDHPDINIYSFESTTIQVQCCIALTKIPVPTVYPTSTLVAAIQIILTKADIEPLIISKAIKILETLMSTQALNGLCLGVIYQKLDKFANVKATTSKEDRILQREATVFLGKYGKNTDTNNNVNNDHVLIAKLHDTLILNIPEQNSNIKINLQEIMHLALKDEDPNALHVILTILCANLSTKKDAILQSTLIRVLVSLARSGVSEDIAVNAVSLCDAVCAHELMRYIVVEKSPQAKAILLTALEVLVRSGEGELLEEIVKQLLAEDEPNTQIIKLILELLNQNNLLSKKYIPNITVKVYAIDINIFKTTAEIFINKIELFDTDLIYDTVLNLFETLKKCQNAIKIVIALKFIRNVYDDKENVNKIIDQVIVDGDVAILIGFNLVFGLNTGQKEKIKDLVEYLDSNNFDTVLDFLTQFSDIIEPNITISILCKIISRVSPRRIIKIHTKMSLCMSGTQTQNASQSFTKSLEKWCQTQAMSEISKNLDKYSFESEDAVKVQALKFLLNIFGSNGSIVVWFKPIAKKWIGSVTELHSTGYIERYIKSKIPYLTDIVEVALKFANLDEIRDIIKGNQKESGIKFCQTFISVISGYLISHPDILMEPGMEGSCVLLNDIVRYAVKRPKTCEHILDFVDKLWPKYESVSSFYQKHALLLDLTVLSSNLGPESNPMQWAVAAVLSEETRREERVMVLEVLPGGESYSASYVKMASALPCRLDELQGYSSTCFRALLGALARNGDHTLVELVATLVDGDNAKGWWDEALDLCMLALAAKEDLAMYNTVFTLSKQARTASVCTQLMLPLLRYSKPSFCEEFFSTILENLLHTLEQRPRVVSTHSSYQKCLLDYIRAFNMLQVVFEKVPKAHIESPGSVLYSNVLSRVQDTLYYIARTVCKLCGTLRRLVVCPEGGDQKMISLCRLVQCTNYNCFVTALCCWNPKPEAYATVFDTKTWALLIGPEDIELPLREQWNQRSTRHNIALEVSPDASLRTARTERTTSLRTRAFVRTLSEDPMLYDLRDVQPHSEEVQVSDNPLNRHDCGATVASLLRRAATLPSTTWREVLVEGLTTLHRNVKWLLAQIICNCKEELKDHASALRPALLDVVATTTANSLLNGLHVDILDTLIYWREDTLAVPEDNLNTVIYYLIRTTLEVGYRTSLYRSLLAQLAQLAEVYAAQVKVDWTVFERYVSDTKSEKSKYCVQILLRLTKSKIYIPELLPAIIKAIEAKWLIPEVMELAGLALATSEKKAEEVKLFRSVLEKTRRSNVEDYVKLLYYSQKHWPECCSESNFRVVSDLLPKTVGRVKRKCTEILAEFVRAYRGKVDSLPLLEMVADDAALLLIRNSLSVMSECSRRRLVLAVAGQCAQAPVKVRRAACGVLLEAFELLLTTEPSEPPAKRRLDSNSLLLKAIDSDDEYLNTVLSVAGSAMTSDMSSDARRIIGDCLSRDVCLRFCESFLIAIYFPVISNSKTSNLSHSIAAMLDVFFRGVRCQDKFKHARLKDEPLVICESNTSTKLTIKSSGLQAVQRQDDAYKSINVQMQVEEILDTFQRYSEKNPEIACAISLELIKVFRGTKRLGFEFDDIMSDVLTRVLSHVCTITPYILQMTRELGCWTLGNKPLVDKLVDLSRGSEGEELVQLIKEDFDLRVLGPEQFVLGCTIFDADVQMDNIQENFSIDDLITTFGKLSNWDNLTLQQKSTIKANLPLIWTDKATFRSSLEEYQGGPVWFDAMHSTYSGKDLENSLKWTRDVHAWPKKHFATSAVVEVLDWISINEDGHRSPTDIRPSDCLAEWSARLMMRSAYLDSIGQERRPADALAWCKRANQSGLHELANRCCASISDLYESETLSWLEQRLIALRAMALERHDRDGLENALKLAENFTPQFLGSSKLEQVWGMQQLSLLLKQDSRVLETRHVMDTLTKIKDQTETPEGKLASKHNKRVLESVCVLSLTYLDSACEDSEMDQSHYDSMTSILGLFVDLNLGPKWTLLLDVILNRLNKKDYTLYGASATCLLKTLQPILPHLDDFSRDQLNTHTNRHSADSVMVQMQDEVKATEKYKKCFMLVADAEYTLYQYCEGLRGAMGSEDKEEWCRIYSCMKEKMFENPYAGPDYQVLFKYKHILYGISDYDSTDEESKKTALLSVVKDLKISKRDTLFISQLCPSLVQKRGEVEDVCLSRLLNIPKTLRVVKFEEKVSVFTDAVRRPAVVTARLSDGTVHRFIVKGGERVRFQAAAVRVLKSLELIRPSSLRGYHVTVLSEDCGLLQYLEDHERIRSLIANVRPVDDILATLQRPSDHELILATRSSAIQQYELLCSKLPAYTLRSAIELNSACLEDFISKKKKFVESVSVTSIATYILGIGDRHLENIMYSLQDGGVCHVDWAAVFQYGGRELPPARLTRNVLAVCDAQVLESRMQALVSALREAHKLVLPTFRVSFQWMGDHFNEIFPYIKALLQGTTMSYKVTEDFIRNSKNIYKEKYIELLEEVFEQFEEKELYTVEEQVSSILRQSTEPRILSVTRSGWEPWI